MYGLGAAGGLARGLWGGLLWGQTPDFDLAITAGDEPLPIGAEGECGYDIAVGGAGLGVEAALDEGIIGEAGDEARGG